MNNLINSTTKLLGVSMTKLSYRLDALTLVLKACTGDECNHPWQALHPDGDVTTLKDALNFEYDEFYKNQNKVKFEHCAKGYIRSNELPLKYNVYGGNDTSDLTSRDIDEMMAPEVLDDFMDWEVKYDVFDDYEVWG